MSGQAAYASSNIVPWSILGSERSTAFNQIDVDDVVDTTTKPADDSSTGRFVAPCDAGGMCLLRMLGGDTVDSTFKVRIYSWSRVLYIGQGTTEYWTPHYHGEILCTLGSMLVFGDGTVGGAGGNLYADTISITNNSGLGSGMRLIGRDNGAGDGTVTPDQGALVLAFDRLGDELVEFQTCVVDASAARPMVKFVSNV